MMTTETTKSVGAVDRLDALAFGDLLILVGEGINPSTGWKNWFEPLRAPNLYRFCQEAPSGIVLPVLMPFKVSNVFPWNQSAEVTVEKLDNGQVVPVKVPVRPASSYEQRELEFFFPGHWVLAAVKRTLSSTVDSTVQADTPPYVLHLGSFDLPFGCASLAYPTRARRFHLYVEARVNVDEDIVKAAIESCLRKSAIAAALLMLLTPIGWAGGTAAFETLLKGCLISELE
ncbi:MAG: hypothetical protein ACYDC1_25035, partial [Limisphaerales bacterium]